MLNASAVLPLPLPLPPLPPLLLLLRRSSNMYRVMVTEAAEAAACRKNWPTDARLRTRRDGTRRDSAGRRYDPAVRPDTRHSPLPASRHRHPPPPPPPPPPLLSSPSCNDYRFLSGTTSIIVHRMHCQTFYLLNDRLVGALTRN